jgi:hypothetical protein
MDGKLRIDFHERVITPSPEGEGFSEDACARAITLQKIEPKAHTLQGWDEGVRS